MAEQATERMVVSATPARCFEVSADIVATPVGRRHQGRHRRGARRRGPAQLVTFGPPPSAAAPATPWPTTSARRPTCSRGSRPRATSPPSWTAATSSLPTGDGGTEVTYHLEVEMKVPLPGFIKMRAQSRIMSIALRELKARVESTA